MSLTAQGRADSSRSARSPGFLRRSFPSFPWNRLPDYLTYARCLAVPLVAATFYNVFGMDDASSRYLTSFLFSFACFTDWLDGFLARRWDVSTAFGAFLDPVADKLAVSTCLVLLSGRYGARVALPSAVVIAREIAVSALREWAAQRQIRGRVKVGLQGKVKTAGTMMTLTVMLAADPVATPVLWRIGMAGLYAFSLVTVTSGSVYFKAIAPDMFSTEYDAKKAS